MLDHDAAIHDNVNSASFSASSRFGVDDSLLNPEVFEPKFEHLVDDGRNELGQAEDVHDIRLDGQIG